MDFDLLNAVAYLEKPDGVVAMPLKYRYVLLCRVSNDEALGRLSRISGAQQNGQPLLLGYDEPALAPFIKNPPAAALKLMRQHWPGDLIIRMGRSVDWSRPWFEPTQLGLMQPDDSLLRDMLSLQPGGVLVAVDAFRYHDAPARKSEEVFCSFGDDVDFVLDRDEWIESLADGAAETVVSIELDGTIRILRSGRVVLD